MSENVKFEVNDNMSYVCVKWNYFFHKESQCLGAVKALIKAFFTQN